MSTLKNTLGGMAGLLAFLIVSSFVRDTINSPTSYSNALPNRRLNNSTPSSSAAPQYSQSDLEYFLKQTSEKTNKSLPMILSGDIRLESTIPGPGLKLTYLYTLLSYSSTDPNVRAWIQSNRMTVLNGVCTSADMKPFIQYGVQLVYLYRGNDGGVAGEIIINPDDCR